MKQLGFVALVLCSIINVGCKESQEELTADTIIEKAIARHGGTGYDNMQVQFDFRNHHFKAIIAEGEYVYERTFKTKEGTVTDVWSNNKFKRMINDKEIRLRKENRRTYQTATNSVIYFALLPFNLDDPIVNRQLMRSVEIKGQPYHKVEITFDENGGGEDFENVYIYWIHKDNFTVDYLAYGFYTNGGGVRYREAYNPREIEGIRFQDYKNYTISKDFPVQEMDYAFEIGELEFVSDIKLENIEVSRSLIAD